MPKLNPVIAIAIALTPVATINKWYENGICIICNNGIPDEVELEKQTKKVTTDVSH